MLFASKMKIMWLGAVLCASLLPQASSLTLHQKPIKVKVTTGTLRCTDNNTGAGFIMYSQQPVNDRWNEDKSQADFRKHTAQNFVCVRRNNESGKWEYDNNWEDETDRPNNISWRVFLPRPTDTLVAAFDFDDDKIANLNGSFKFKDFKGMSIGYAYGDLNFFPNQNHSGHPDVGEVRMNGTYIVPFEWSESSSWMSPTTTLKAPYIKNKMRHVPVKTGGMSCTDSNTGAGFIMYSKKFINARWNQDKSERDFRVHSAENFVCVRYKDNNWQYDTNWEDEAERESNVSWHIFMPDPTDVLVASVDFDNDKVLDLKSSNITYMGVPCGYQDGDLVFFPNQTQDGTEDGGEFRLAGSFIAPWPKDPATTTTTTTTTTTGTTTTPIYLQPPPNASMVKMVKRRLQGGTIRCTGDNIFPGFIMYSLEDVGLRFLNGQQLPEVRPHYAALTKSKTMAPHLICVRFKKDRWQYDSNARDDVDALKLHSRSWHDFKPRPDDVVVATVDFVKDTSKLLSRVRARSYGMQFGFYKGNMKAVNLRGGNLEFKPGWFISWGHPK
eukprot:TRINITY_DN812_c0_g1_i1.p1 TRINITY_DN812_c0_g1~~TRINITY_DN812_c0_g1_i1.p1  ORF type:complete len:553 (+),score=106.64 TRINITY_DN812_c0_g1_i1:67-1725(+)